MKRTAWLSMAMVITLLVTGWALSVSANQGYCESGCEAQEIRGNSYELAAIEGRRNERQHFGS